MRAPAHHVAGARAREPRCDRQQLVWIGVGLDVDAVHEALSEALIDDAEEAAGLEAWVSFDDPLPAWD